MFDAVKQDVEEIRQLALSPTPQNFQAINCKLESMAGFLSESVAAAQAGKFAINPALRSFLRELPQQTSFVRMLMEAPLSFYQALNNIHAVQFGSYERDGHIRCLQPAQPARTVMHL